MGARKCTKELLTALAARMTAAQIAAELNMYVDNVYRILKRHGIEPVRPPRRKLKVPKASLVAMYERMTASEIACKLRCSRTTVLATLRHYEIRKSPTVRQAQLQEASAIGAAIRASKKPDWARRPATGSGAGIADKPHTTACTPSHGATSVFDRPTYNPNARDVTTRYVR